MTTSPRLRVGSLLAGLLLTATVGAVASVAPDDGGTPERPVTAGSRR